MSQTTLQGKRLKQSRCDFAVKRWKQGYRLKCSVPHKTGVATLVAYPNYDEGLLYDLRLWQTHQCAKCPHRAEDLVKQMWERVWNESTKK